MRAIAILLALALGGCLFDSTGVGHDHVDDDVDGGVVVAVDADVAPPDATPERPDAQPPDPPDGSDGPGPGHHH